MLSLLRTHTGQQKWTSKREISIGKAVRKRMRGECPVAGAGAPGSGAPRTLFLTAFTIGFSRFEGHFCCPVWVLRRDSISAHVWYGLRTNSLYCAKMFGKKDFKKFSFFRYLDFDEEFINRLKKFFRFFFRHFFRIEVECIFNNFVGRGQLGV